MNKTRILVLIIAIALVYVVLNTRAANGDKRILDCAQIEEIRGERIEIKPVALQDDSTTWGKIKKLFE